MWAEREGPIARLIHALFHLRSILAIALTLVFVAAFLLTFFLAPKWASIIVGIPFTLYTYGVWAYLLYRLLYQYRFLPPISPLVPLADFFLIYTITVLQNAALYASIAMLQSGAFIGIPSDDIPRGHVLYLAFFLATETLSALGTGSIFANPFVWESIGFVAVWLESIQALLTFTFVSWGLTRQVARHAKNVRSRVLAAREATQGTLQTGKSRIF